MAHKNGTETSSALRRVQTHADLDIWPLTSNKMGDQDSCTVMYYPPAKFGDDMSIGWCFRVLTYTRTTHTYRADKRPTPATTSVWLTSHSQRQSRMPERSDGFLALLLNWHRLTDAENKWSGSTFQSDDCKLSAEVGTCPWDEHIAAFADVPSPSVLRSEPFAAYFHRVKKLCPIIKIALLTPVVRHRLRIRDRWF